MRKTLLFVVGALVVTASCRTVNTNIITINKDVEYSGSLDISLEGLPKDTNIQIPPGGITASLPTFGNATNSKQYIEEYNTSPDKIISAKVGELKMTISPSPANFDCVDTLRVYISATGMEEKLLGYKYGIPKGTKLVEMERPDLSVKDFFLQDSIFFRVSGHFLAFPPDSSKLDFKCVFNVKANPLK